MTENSAWEKEPEIDYFTMICPGKAGYQVKISGGDHRYALFSLVNGTEVTLTEIGAFHDLGANLIEWRGPVGRRPTSLIYRLSISNPDGMSSNSILYVIRLMGTESCKIGRVRQGANMNERARAIADNPNAPCLSL